jgi:hypothetical protein
MKAKNDNFKAKHKRIRRSTDDDHSKTVANFSPTLKHRKNLDF